MRVVEAMPNFALELHALLERSERPALADQVATLELQSRCCCGDDFCSTFHTRAGQVCANLELDSSQGLIVVELDRAERILSVEVLYRPDVEQELRAALDAK